MDMVNKQGDGCSREERREEWYCVLHVEHIVILTMLSEEKDSCPYVKCEGAPHPPNGDPVYFLVALRRMDSTRIRADDGNFMTLFHPSSSLLEEVSFGAARLGVTPAAMVQSEELQPLAHADTSLGAIPASQLL
jgi:hypothetical protein